MILRKQSPLQKLLDKFADILTSPRFWMIIVGGVLVGLKNNDWKAGAISALTAVVVVGSADSVATKSAGK